jgi:hypothetical protein
VPNWRQYLGQRVELESRFIQIAFLFADGATYVESKMDQVRRDAILQVMNRIREGQPLISALGMILDCKGCALI